MKKIQVPETAEAGVRTRWKIESTDELQHPITVGEHAVGCYFLGALYPEGTVIRKGDVVAICSSGVWVGAPPRNVVV